MLRRKDIDFIEIKGIELNQFKTHLNNFKSGFPYAKLHSAANVGNGIIQFNGNEIESLIKFFDLHTSKRELLKFVPASGAASRMFKHLFEYREQLEQNSAKDHKEDKNFNSAAYFFNHLTEFAFYNDLSNSMNENSPSLDDCIQHRNHEAIINYLLDIKGLQYAALPKALLKFHQYKDGARMAFEEHLVEGANYCKNDKDKVNIHFTVSPEHREKFTDAIARIKDKYESRFGVRFNIDFSIQKPSTDMIAVDLDNQPLRNENGDLVFRPGGHGALIENLNDIDGDIVFIKNIDNIVPDKIRETTYTYKKVIAAHLLKTQEQTFEYLRKLKAGQPSEELISEIEAFAQESLFIDLSDAVKTEDRIDFLFKKLIRPIRVCGMVKNEGEPGGGPFWVLDENNTKSLQIVESSQINLKNEDQQRIVNEATHFNPVDLVCGLRNFEGEKFDLKKFIDPQTGFISIKSQNGKELKAQELPGLWNGAMTDWITIFVECPIITFNPVKTINDLLREQHQ
jgi:hypothetical protein